MQQLLAKLSEWNARMNGIPRMLLLIALTLFIAALVVVVLPYCWPFAVALVFSMVLEPFVRLVSGWLQKAKMGRSIATLLGMLLLFGLVVVLLFMAVNRLWRELLSLVEAAPRGLAWVNETAIPWVREQYAQYQSQMPPYVNSILDNAVASFGKTLGDGVRTVTTWVTAGAWTTALSMVDVVLSVVLTIMGTYYLTADKERITAFFRRTFPLDVQRHSRLIKTNLIKSLFGQIKSQLNVSLIIITFLAAAFMIFGVRYGLLLGLLIGVADGLPVVGAGLFLIPLSILGFITGDIPQGIFMACCYVGTIVIRQIFEPRIVGKNLGLYPLATMIAMYAGYRAFGFLGLLGGPVMLNVVKVVLEADRAAMPAGEAVPASLTVPAAADPPGAAERPKVETPPKTMPRPDGEVTLPNGAKKPFKVKGR